MKFIERLLISILGRLVVEAIKRGIGWS